MINRPDPRLTRRWVIAVALPTLAALLNFWLSRVVEGDGAQGMAFALALTFTVVACTVGPLVCWSYRTRLLADQLEDELADVRCELRQLRNDNGATSLALEHLRRRYAGEGWVPPGPTPPRPPLSLIRRDEG